MSWESTADCYHLAYEEVRDRLGGYHSARIVLDSVDFADVERMQAEGRWADAAHLLANRARAVERAGADLLVLCTNTMHKVTQDIEAAVTIPVHMPTPPLPPCGTPTCARSDCSAPRPGLTLTSHWVRRGVAECPAPRPPTGRLKYARQRRLGMNRKKQHHTVPKSYLSGFSSGRTLTAVNVHTGKAHGISAHDATTQRGFYAVPDHPNPDAFEDALSRIEGAAANLLARIAHGYWPLQHDERVTLSVFITLQFLRGPDHREQIRQLSEHLLRRLSPEELKRLGVSSPDLSAEDLTATHLQQIVALAPELAGVLIGRPWLLISFDEPSLITSDAPLTALPDPRLGADAGLGLGNAFALLFPLNRRLGLQMNHPGIAAHVPGGMEVIVAGEADAAIAGDEVRRSRFNNSTVRFAHERIFHHPDDAALVPGHFRELRAAGGRINFADIPDGLLPAP
ncbi:DUF4238 domain-containing protein [Microbacterium sp. CFH 31415]|nr:DUF4238 domain-containing protein [Microbacterium sp. CFH 31415]